MVVDDVDGRVRVSDLYNLYTSSCSDIQTALNKQQFGRLLRKLFPLVHVINTRERKSRNTMTYYTGISLQSPKDCVSEEPSTLCQLARDVPDGCFVLSSSNDKLEIAIFSNVVSCGNAVLKYVTLRPDHWALTIRDKNIDLFGDLGISDMFDCTKELFFKIVDIVAKVGICKGCPLSKNILQMSKMSTKERISMRGDANSEETRYRTGKCEQVVKWLQTGDACRNCYRNLGYVQIDNSCDNDEVRGVINK